MPATPSFIRIVEVGPRDGLQNESKILSPEIKIHLIDLLSNTGLQTIEAGAFVSPKWIPQMADTGQVLSAIKSKPGVTYPVLVPNAQGLSNALTAGARDIAVFTAASETFCSKNINCSIDQSFDRFAPVFETAKDQSLNVRGYVSCALGCPYEGNVSIASVVSVAKRLLEAGCSEISIGDTIGVGTPLHVRLLIQALQSEIPSEKLAVHFHDTYGQALANILVAIEQGISVVDSAVSGLGGCPYAKGSAGNVATEDVLYMIHGMGIETNVDLEAVAAAGNYICQKLGRKSQSRVVLAKYSDYKGLT